MSTHQQALSKRQEREALHRATDVSNRLRPGEWTGKPCFIIGGGPSLRDVDTSLFDEFKTLGCNMAFLWSPDVVLAMDARVFEIGTGMPEWAACRDSIKITSQSAADRVESFGPNAYTIKFGSMLKDWPSRFEDGLPPSSNTGASAIAIADVLGADPIFLLGFDLSGEDGVSANWHDAYPEKWKSNELVYDRFRTSFLRVFDSCNARVVNCNPESELRLFPLCTIEEALALARGEIEYDMLFASTTRVGTEEGIKTVKRKEQQNARQTDSDAGRLVPIGCDELVGLQDIRHTRGARSDASSGRAPERERADKPARLGGLGDCGAGNDRRMDHCVQKGAREVCAHGADRPEDSAAPPLAREADAVAEGERRASSLVKSKPVVPPKLLEDNFVLVTPEQVLDSIAKQPSNINEHLHTLRDLAKQCRVVAEFGTGQHCRSTTAFVAARPEVVRSYDIEPARRENTILLTKLASVTGVDLKFVQADTGKTTCFDSRVDMLFVDSLHDGAHVTNELLLHAHAVDRYLVFHDVVTYGWRSEVDPSRAGVLDAVFSFMRDCPDWRVHSHFTNNNGLLVLEREGQS